MFSGTTRYFYDLGKTLKINFALFYLFSASWLPLLGGLSPVGRNTMRLSFRYNRNVKPTWQKPQDHSYHTLLMGSLPESEQLF